MEKPKIKVLLAEDNPGTSPFWEDILATIRDVEIGSVHIKQLSDVRRQIGSEAPDVILLDLSLPESKGLEVFLQVYEMAPTIPILVVTADDDQKLAVQTALEGAQDCLVKSDLNGFLLSRAMRYAIGRQKHMEQLRAFSVIDELTGLYNRRGFLTLAEQQIKLAKRIGQSLLLVFADVDRLKAINDKLGHHRGDLALMETAHVLREAFREADVLGRLSGDEFVGLMNCGGNVDEKSLTQRFQGTLAEHNAYRKRSFKLSISIGFALYDHHSPCSVENLLLNADKAMYAHKKSKKLAFEPSLSYF